MKNEIILLAIVAGGLYTLREYEDSMRLGAPMFSQQLKLLRQQDF
ncbi:MAG: hypothetical protein OQL08_01530 [Gammaproteobacteria bacterium]|nr:hypothetical protein [Gammaproteobacteria bacterium]